MKRFCMLLVIMLFGFGLIGCSLEGDLESYKASSKKELQDYVSDIDNTKKNWEMIYNEVENGFISIDNAETMKIIDDIVDNVKTTINQILKDEFDMELILKQFDLTGQKLIWQGDINDEFTDDVIILALKKTSTYPELKLEHFGINTAVSIEYVNGVFPPDYYFTVEYEKALANYRQIVLINVLPEGKNKIVEIIRKLEKLDFVRSVVPNNIEHGN